MLTRLRLPAIRDRLDALLEEAARREMNLREALAWLCAAYLAWLGAFFAFVRPRVMAWLSRISLALQIPKSPRRGGPLCPPALTKLCVTPEMDNVATTVTAGGRGSPPLHGFGIWLVKTCHFDVGIYS